MLIIASLKFKFFSYVVFYWNDNIKKLIAFVRLTDIIQTFWTI